MDIREIYYELDINGLDIVLCFTHAVRCVSLGAMIHQMTSPYDDGLHSCDVCCHAVTLEQLKDIVDGNN